MSDPLPDVTADLTAAAPLMARAVSFCNRCGRPLDPTSGACDACEARQLAAGERAAAIAPDAASARSAVWLYFALLAVSLVITLATLSAGRRSATVLLFGDVGLAAVTLAWVVKERGALAAPLRRVGPWWAYPLAAATGLATFVVFSLFVRLLKHFLSLDAFRYSEPFDDAGYGFWVVVLAIAVQPAIFEELAFRGVMTEAFSRSLTPGETLVVTSLMFGILHLAVPMLVPLTVLGMVLFLFRRLTGSLYPCMVLHFTHNLMVLFQERWAVLPW